MMLRVLQDIKVISWSCKITEKKAKNCRRKALNQAKTHVLQHILRCDVFRKLVRSSINLMQLILLHPVVYVPMSAKPRLTPSTSKSSDEVIVEYDVSCGTFIINAFTLTNESFTLHRVGNEITLFRRFMHCQKKKKQPHCYSIHTTTQSIKQTALDSSKHLHLPFIMLIQTRSNYKTIT